MASVDNGATVQLTGETKLTPAVGQTGKPTQAHGYGTMLFTALTPNDQSSDRGSSGSLLTEKFITPAAGQTGKPTSNKGTYGAISITASGSNAYSTDRGGSISPSSTLTPILISYAILIKYYKMIGFYVAGAVYEEFITIGVPTSASTINPNTGHALINCYVSTFWQQ